MADDDCNKLTPIELIQALVSLACITAAFLVVATSFKGWSAGYAIEEASYDDILALREDRWLGISREARPVMISWAIMSYAPVVLLAALRRTTFHVVACAACGLGLIAAGIAWFLVPHI